MKERKTPSGMVQDAHGRVVEIVAVDAEEASTARLNLALRTLARLMVRAHRESGDGVANVGDVSRSAALTSARHPRTHHGDEAA